MFVKLIRVIGLNNQYFIEHDNLMPVMGLMSFLLFYITMKLNED